MSIVVRKYCNDDYDVVKNILFECFPEVNDLLEKSLVDDGSLNLNKNKYIQLVAVEDNKVVGYTIASKNLDPIIMRNNIWIDYVCVTSSARGKGIAKKMLIEIERIARDENVLFLQLTSSRFRESARKLYLDLGFEIRESDIFRKVLK